MIPQARHQSYLARQVSTLCFSHVQVRNPMAAVRAAAWYNIASRLGIYLPLFLTHDVGLLLTMARGGAGGDLQVAAREDLFKELRLSREARGHLSQYQQLLQTLAQSEVVEKAGAFRLRDEMIAVLLVKIFGDVYHRFPDPAKRAGVEELPLDPQIYEGADLARHFRDFDQQALFGFLRFLISGNQPLHVYTCLEQIDLDTVRLLSMFTPLSQHGAGTLQPPGLLPGAAGVQLDLLDLYGVFQSAEANDVVNFSLDLIPSVLETKRASGAQVFSADGYSSIERRGNLDSLILTELACDDDLFESKVIDDELYYYGHEKQQDEERRLQYILVDASPSMRGMRQVFGRGLALTMAKKFSLQGDEAWVRFFDARLHDIVRVTKSGADYATPYLLCFRSDRGRNYARVFRQLQLELLRLRREERRQIVVYIVTHGQCHIPVEIVQALAKVAFLYGIFIMPSTEVQLDYLPWLQRYQVVNDKILTSQKDRRDRALQIVEDASQQGQPGKPAAPRPEAPRPRKAP